VAGWRDEAAFGQLACLLIQHRDLLGAGV